MSSTVWLSGVSNLLADITFLLQLKLQFKLHAQAIERSLRRPERR
jgi:hypothetical protein